jgi:periplasmic copper chaperone A
MRTHRRVAVIALMATGALFLVAAPALAHVEPDPTRVKPGKKATVEFTPEHGCGESVTTQMDFQVPKGVKGAKPLPLDGWTSSVHGRKITFASDKVPSAEASFGITFTAPSTKTVLAWKVIQRCQAGVNRWLEGPKGENPAPLVGVGKNPPSVEEKEPTTTTTS